MPMLDGTGPMGFGPGTGRGMGPCGRRYGFGRGYGFGLGRRFGYPYVYAPTKEDEEEILKERERFLKEELEATRKMLEELEK